MKLMPSQRTRAPLSDWFSLTRISNLPTIVSDSLVGVALALALQWIPDVSSITAAIEVTLAMCAFYGAGMILNGIVDREIDARERPTRPIASGRIALPWAWSAFILLMLFGFYSRPSWGTTPLPVAVAALIGVWLLTRAREMRSHTLHRLAGAWCVVACLAALWWAIDLLVRDPFDLADFEENTRHTIRMGHIAVNLPVLVIAISLVAYNLLHKRTGWSIVFLVLCRVGVPLAVAAAILVPSGHVTRLWPMFSLTGSLAASSILSLLLVPLAIAIHTLVLSIVARREMEGNGATFRCARCGYQLVTAAPKVCTECGCDLTDVPPLGDRPLAPRSRFTLPLLASVGLIPLLAIVIPGVWVMRYGFFGTFPTTANDVIYGQWRELFIVNHPLFLILAVWFVIAATRGLRAALSHPSRRPAGIAALIAAFALLDACAAAALQSPVIALACVALWFVTRFAQRRVAGS